MSPQYEIETIMVDMLCKAKDDIQWSDGDRLGQSHRDLQHLSDLHGYSSCVCICLPIKKARGRTIDRFEWLCKALDAGRIHFDLQRPTVCTVQSGW